MKSFHRFTIKAQEALQSAQDLAAQARGKGYDYDRMKADGLTDDQVRQTLKL